jgi:hypothetical protein
VTSERRLLAEVAALARHLHWPLAELLDLEHPDRRLFLAEVERAAEADAASVW